MKRLVLIFVTMMIVSAALGQSERFCIAKDGKVATIVVDTDDWKGVIRAANDLGDDVRKVTGKEAPLLSPQLGGRTDTDKLLTQLGEAGRGLIIVGTIGKSRLIDKLIKQKKLDIKKIKGHWEGYVIDVVDGHLVIAGNDKRGTIYGIYELSKRIGVSPWYWMADAPVVHQDELYYDDGYEYSWPAVKYRGIFINDEWPSFGTWCQKHFGGVNSKAYEKIFELLLRLKANYFWPAMWATNFNEDDPESPRLADEMGIVMGTSHHEPMMRSHREYLQRKEQVGPWDYATNKERVDQFFREGMERNKAYDNLVTIGMRGDGDVAMGKGDDQENMRTLKNVIDGQRRIIKDIYGRPEAVPQLWAIFTAVPRYYDAGFTVPDDVTLLFCDNNWGYIRRKGTEKERKRKGGLGLYYHIDMNGGPWNDRWVNTTTVPKLREQLNLAYQSGIDRIWIINVGDLKPKEMPISFIMDYAWDPECVDASNTDAWLRQWTASVLGGAAAEDTKEAADIIADYSKYNLWRKPEVQVPGLFNYAEMLRLNNLWQSVVLRCEALKERIPASAQDAFYQLVYYPAVASAGVAMIYNAATMGDSITVNHLMAKDQRLTDYYNKVLAGGKWDGMMLDNHIGYTQWSIPDKNRHPMSLGYKVDHPLLYSFATPSKEYSIRAIDFVNTKREVHPCFNGWEILWGLGRGDGCMGAADVMKEWPADGSGPALEYEVTISPSIQGGDRGGSIAIGILPTQDIMPARGLRLGVQIDDQPMQVIDARQGFHDEFQEYTPKNLAQSKNLKPLPPHNNLLLSGWKNGRKMLRRDEVFDNMRWLEVNFPQVTPGNHKLKLVMIDPEIVIETIVVNPDNNRYSYFGTPAQTKYCGPVPSENQLRWQDMEMYAFIHYSMNTYTDQEWGFGNEDPKLFNPSDLDCRQWARVCKQAGMKGIIFTAKHHCGFCMWPSKYTEYSVKNAPWKNGKGDVVRELAEACREEGLKFAVYLSPWDRNHKDYGKPEYITYFRNQLRELLTEYGDIFEVWFDGANGGDGWYGGANETRRIDGKTYYQWAETFRMIRELQPHAVIWNDGGDRGDLRWVGTEAGNVGETNWSLMPSKGDTPYPMLHYGVEDGDVWCPGETNTSIRPGWFYHETENEHVKSLSKLMDTYYKSVGRNSTLLLNFPIAPNGRIHPNDSLRGIAFKKMIDEVFKENLAEKGRVVKEGMVTTIDFGKPVAFNRFVAEEDIALGQRVKKFSLEVFTNGQWQPLKDALVDNGDGLTTIGHRRIICFPTVKAAQLRFTITDSKAVPVIKKLGVYLAPDLTADIPDSGEKKSSALHIFFSSPTQMMIDWDQEQTFTTFRYLPPQDSKDGLITHYTLWASTDWSHWTKLASGEFSNIVNNPIWQTIKFPATKARIIKLDADRLAEGSRMGYGDIELK